MRTAPRPIPGRPDETPRPGTAGPRTPYPVNDPGFADPKKPGSEPDYIPSAVASGNPRIVGTRIEPKIGDSAMTRLNTAGRRRLPARDFAEPNKRAYPVDPQR
jgi:hypothetical protein